MSKISEVSTKAYEEFLTDYKEKAMELTAANDEDWMRINYALAGWYETEVTMEKMGLTGKRAAVALRCLAGAIYAMGFESGKALGNVEREIEEEEKDETHML